MNRADNGTRVSDSSTSLQVPSDGGGGYTIVGNPNAFGTSAGKIISNTEPNAQALLEALTADVRMGFKLDALPTAGAYKGLTWRGDGTSQNYYAMRITQGGNNLTFFRKVAGVGPLIDTNSLTPVAGDIFEVEHNAGTLKFYRNGSLITGGWSVSGTGIFADDNTVRGTKHGLFTSADSVGKWDDLVITDIGSLSAGTPSVNAFTVSTITLVTTEASGGTGPYTHQWQIAPDVAGSAGTFANVGSPGLSLVATGLTAGTRYWFRQVATDSLSATATSSNISQTTAGGSSVVVPITDPNWRADPGVWWSVGGSGTMPASNIRPTGTTSIVSANQGAKLKTPKFSGSLSCTLDLLSNHLGSALGVRWRKNGGAWSAEVPVGSATTAVIVSGLSGTNEIEFILARAGGAADAFTLPLDSTPADILRVVSCTLNPGATIIGPPTTKLKNIIAYGDSNLMDNGDADATKSWIAIAGTGLGAEYGAIDYGSTAYVSGTVTSQNVPHVFEFDGTGFDSKYATGQDRAVDPEPDIVFLTHGAKDIQTVQTQADVIARLWTNSTTGQLPTLRARWPGALIVLCVPICRGNLATGTIVDAFTAAVTLMNDPRVILFDAGTTLAAGFSPTATAGAATAYSTDGVHMNGTAHQLYGDAITTFVSNFLGPSGSGSGSGGTRFQDLPVALSATDADELLLVQNGLSKRIGRGSMLAGVLTVGPQGPTGATGAGGAAGAAGPAGSTGPGVPSGGSAGQSLFKIDATDFNTIWRRPASGVDVASFATAGAGTQGSPWTGWDTAITWAARTRYNCRSGYYAYATAPNLLFEGIEIIGEPGTFWVHTGTGNAFIMDAGASTGVWVPNVRVENIQVNGSPTLLTGTLSVTSGAAAVTGSGTAFLSQVAVGDAISFSYGTSNNRSYIVSAIADDTHLTINRNATVTEAAVNAKVTKTRNGFFLRGVIRGVFDRLRAHDVAVAGLWTEACVTNSLRDFRVSTFGPTDIQFQCRPQYGIATQGRSTDWSTTWNIEEPVIEGTQIYGIWLTASSYGTTIINGTSESNIGVGIQIDGGSNTLINVDVEGNTGGDIVIGASANTNTFINIYSLGTITCSGGRNNFFGGRYQNLTIAAGTGNFVIGPTFNGTFTDSGNGTVYITKTGSDFTSYVGIPLPVLKAITASGSMATNCLLGNLFTVAMFADATLNAPSNPLPGMEITYRFDNSSGSAKAITWNAIFEAGAQSLPTTIANGKTIYVRFRYSSFWATWQCLQVVSNAATPKVRIDAHYSTPSSPADAATITFDCSVSNVFTPLQLGGNRTLAVSNDTDGQIFDVVLKQDSAGSRTVTWWSGILWEGGTVPTLTTTVNKRDWFRFLRLSSGVYLGKIVGQNY